MLTDLGLPEDLTELLAERLDRAYRVVRAGLAANTAVTIDDDGKIHVASVKAIEEPPSLIDLRKRVEAMMPQVDISEAIVEVLGWCPKFMEAFTSIAGTGPPPDGRVRGPATRRSERRFRAAGSPARPGRPQPDLGRCLPEGRWALGGQHRGPYR
ncbi:hypothetical protein ACFLIM_41995 [Nonomuraea sp. M3C6]|uniref:Uncharacterized protein n=1 Tax=Nonomuraea marmarensis TaxID=3351344 RepID=A0ABW7ART8_9ACTN